MGGGCCYGRGKETSAKLVVCLENAGNDSAVARAETMAWKMFGPVGVDLEWRDSARSCRTAGPQAIIIDLAQNAPENAGPAALAQAHYLEGIHIEVFQDRISKVPPDFQSVLMAHVFVHEITHILQGVPRHSETGVMKAQWSRADYAQMRRQPLRFTPEDIRLIRQGLVLRAVAR
jgi:hypothetical protein